MRTPTSAWEIYNRKAAVYDKELIKDWNASLNTLLVFVSAVPLHISSNKNEFIV
jgi:hypothetical protein